MILDVMMSEEWRDVRGFEGVYSVSNLGRVKSHPRPTRTKGGVTRWHAGGTMTPVLDRDGYPRVILRVDGKHYTRRVHRLVCEAFHGPALQREVDHIDRDRANASADNLRWVSRAENLALRPNGVGYAKLNESAARDIFAVRGTVTAKAAAQAHGVTLWAVYKIWKGERWAAATGAKS